VSIALQHEAAGLPMRPDTRMRHERNNVLAHQVNSYAAALENRDSESTFQELGSI
jgi:hypothetical protein